MEGTCSARWLRCQYPSTTSYTLALKRWETEIPVYMPHTLHDLIRCVSRNYFHNPLNGHVILTPFLGKTGPSQEQHIPSDIRTNSAFFNYLESLHYIYLARSQDRPFHLSLRRGSFVNMFRIFAHALIFQTIHVCLCTLISEPLEM